MFLLMIPLNMFPVMTPLNMFLMMIPLNRLLVMISMNMFLVMTPMNKITIKAFVCENCGKSYSKAHKLKEHRISHKPRPCKYCDKQFKSYSSLRDHLTLVHENSKFICLACQKQFTTVKPLQFHQHNNTCQRELIKNKKCTKCHLKFKTDKTMKQHMSLKHIEDEEI